MDFLERAADFIRGCDEKTALIYDIDGDSIGSAVIIAKTIERLFHYVPAAFPINHDLFAIDKGIYKEIRDNGIKNIIIVDVAIDETPEYVLKLAESVRVLVIDHHQIHKNLNKVKNILYVNPHFWKSKVEPVKYCTSKITYDICAKTARIEDLAWLAGMGIINDYCGETWKDFLDMIYERYPILKQGKEPYSFDSNLGLINHMITSGYYHSGMRGGKIAYEACIEVSSPLELLEAKTSKSKVLKKYYEDVQDDINETVNNWRDNAEIHEDKKLIFLKLTTSFSIQSPVATILGIKAPNYTWVIFRRKGESIHVSLRRNDGKIDCGKLAEEATKGLENANGGGHKPASGAHIMAVDLKKFKENILKYLRL